jgi:addiction module HigA family antidote
MATNRMRPIHPGEVLREEYLVPLNMTAHALAMALHLPAPRINEIVREKRAITPNTALRLARFFDSTAEFWMNLQSAYDLRKAELENAVQIRREVRPFPGRGVPLPRHRRWRRAIAGGTQGLNARPLR